jgi:hypothetical protein
MPCETGFPSPGVDRLNPLLFLVPQVVIGKKLAQTARTIAARVQHNQIEADLRAGRLPVFTDPPILLARGETCHWIEQGIAVLEPKTVITARGSAGVNVRYRIAPGLSVGGRVGASAPVKSERLVTLAQGNLIVTNKRLVVIGLDGTLEIPFSKLVACHDGGDCVVIATKNKSAQMYLTGKGIKFSILARIIQTAFQSA